MRQHALERGRVGRGSLRRAVFAALGPMVLLWAACSGPNMVGLQRFGDTQVTAASRQTGEFYDIAVTRIGATTLRELFGNRKVDKDFIVLWVHLSAPKDTPLAISRNQISLSMGKLKLFPVDSARVAYLGRLMTTPGASLAFIPWAGWVAALASVEGVESANAKRQQEGAVNALPEEIALQAGSSLSGFLYFEPPHTKMPADQKMAREADLQLSVTISTDGRKDVSTLRGIPTINPSVKKGGGTDEKKG